MTDGSHRLVIDCQVFQTATWHRGIGKYSLELLAHARPSLPFEEVVLLFNASLPFDDDVRTVVKDRIQDVTTVFVPLLTGKKLDVDTVTQENTKAIDTLFAERGWEGSAFLIPAPFLGSGPCPVFPSGAGSRLMIFYDIIPLLYAHEYLKTSPARATYLPRHRAVLEADLIFAISQTVADDLSVTLGLPEHKVVSIGGAAVGRGALSPKRPTLPTNDRFVLLPSGNDFRKNNGRAVQGFELFLSKTPSSLKLVLTSDYPAWSKVQLSRRSRSLVFAGNVTEREMAWLYQNAEAILFATECEGLGLPVLEGVEAGKPVVCSDIASFREISRDAFYYFDPYDVASIAEGLDRALVSATGDFEDMRAHYPNILDRYSWPATAARMAAATALAPVRADVREKPRIAVLGPNPRGGSAVGKAMQELHPSLAEHFDVDYFLEPATPLAHRADYLGSVTRTFGIKSFGTRSGDYDAVIYHLMDDPGNARTAAYALQIPGFVVLHDTMLGRLFAGLVSGGFISAARYKAERALHRALKPRRSRLLASLVNDQRGVIVASEYARRAVDEVAIRPIPCRVLAPPVGVPQIRRHGARAQVRIGVAGDLGDADAMNAIRRLALNRGLAGARIDAVGYGHPKDPLLLALSALPNTNVVVNPTDFEYQQRLSDIDILVTFGAGHRGEIVPAVLESMRFGAVNVVCGGKGWLAELPRDCVVRARSEEELVKRVRALVADAPRREEIGLRAKEYISLAHSHERYVGGFVELIASAPRVERGGTSHVGWVERTQLWAPLARASVHDAASRTRGKVRGLRGSPVSVPARTEHAEAGRRTVEVAPMPAVDVRTVSSVRRSVPEPLRRSASAVRRSRPAARADFDKPWFHKWATALGEPVHIHRKLWEWCEILQASADAGRLQPGLSALGFGVGREPIPATLARLGLHVLATDLPTSDLSGSWAATNQHANDSSALLTGHVDPDVVARLVRFQPFNMCDDLTPLGHHDLVWSSCVIEHLGSPAAGLDFVRRSLDLLNPGGVAIHTTEMELTARKVSVDYGHCAIYTPEHLGEFFGALPEGFSYSASFSIPLEAPEDCHVDLPPYDRGLPHLKLALNKSITTSFSITIVRDRS